MITKCVAPIKAEVARFTLLNTCGVTVTGAGSAQIVTDSFTEIVNTPNYEEGQRFLLRKASGRPCVNERDPGFFNWLEQEVTLCTLDPDLIAVITGESVIVSGSDRTGVIFGEGLLTNHFSLEVWQPVSGADACTPGGQLQFVYWAFPHVTDAQIQEFTFANDTFTIGYASITKSAHPSWAIGNPWLVGGTVATWGPGHHYAFNVTTVPPPSPFCGAITI